MAEDTSYLTEVSAEDTSVLKNLSIMGEHLKELKKKMITAEAELDAAKKEYEHYANVVLPAQMFSAGLSSLSLNSGGVLTVKRDYYCQPNKNDTDRAIIAQWLREHGAEHLIKASAEVSTKDIEALKDSHIPFIEKSNINTQSLKALIKDMLGINGGTKQIEVEDIPKCIHFTEVQHVEISI